MYHVISLVTLLLKDVLYNSIILRNTFIFNLSRLTNEIALLECFSVPTTGTFNVLAYESGSSNTWTLPSITITNNNAKQVRNGMNNYGCVSIGKQESYYYH